MKALELKFAKLVTLITGLYLIVFNRFEFDHGTFDGHDQQPLQIYQSYSHTIANDSAAVQIVLSCEINQRPGLYALINSILLNTNHSVYIHLLVEHTTEATIVMQEFNFLFREAILFEKVGFEIRAFGTYQSIYATVSEYITLRAPDSGHASHCHSPMTYARLWLPLIFPMIDKAIYLDIDFIVQSDIYNLFMTDTTSNMFWAVFDSRNSFQYLVNNQTDSLQKFGVLDRFNSQAPTFNAGLYVLNFSYWRRNALTDRCYAIMEHNRNLQKNWINSGDQSILNLVLNQSIIGALDSKWNVLHLGWKKTGNYYLSHVNTEQILVDYVTVKNGYALHWNGARKPWLKSKPWNTQLFAKYIPKRFNKESIYNFSADWVSYRNQKGLPEWSVNENLIPSLKLIKKYIYDSRWDSSNDYHFEVSDIISWNPQNIEQCTCEPKTYRNEIDTLSVQVKNMELDRWGWITIFIDISEQYLLFTHRQRVLCAFNDGTTVISKGIYNNNLIEVKCKVPFSFWLQNKLGNGSGLRYTNTFVSLISPNNIQNAARIQSTAIRFVPVCSKYHI